MEQKTEVGLGVGEIAGLLRLHPNTVRRYIKSGDLEVTWDGGYRATLEAVERCRRKLAARKIATGRLG